MNAPKKFLFDTQFEPDAAGTATAAKGASVKPEFTRADVDRARDEGFQAGRRTGAEDAERAAQQRVAQALGVIERQLSTLSESHVAASLRQAREAAQAALGVVGKLFPRLAAAHGLAEIEAVVRECMERLRDEPRIVIRVADELLDDVERRVQALGARAGFEGRIVFLAQEELAPGDVRVEWADGGAERNSAETWRAISTVLSRALGEALVTPPLPTDRRPAASVGSTGEDSPVVQPSPDGTAPSALAAEPTGELSDVR